MDQTDAEPTACSPTRRTRLGDLHVKTSDDHRAKIPEAMGRRAPACAGWDLRTGARQQRAAAEQLAIAQSCDQWGNNPPTQRGLLSALTPHPDVSPSSQDPGVPLARTALPVHVGRASTVSSFAPSSLDEENHETMVPRKESSRLRIARAFSPPRAFPYVSLRRSATGEKRAPVVRRETPGRPTPSSPAPSTPTSAHRRSMLRDVQPPRRSSWRRSASRIARQALRAPPPPPLAGMIVIGVDDVVLVALLPRTFGAHLPCRDGAMIASRRPRAPCSTRAPPGRLLDASAGGAVRVVVLEELFPPSPPGRVRRTARRAFASSDVVSESDRIAASCRCRRRHRRLDDRAASRPRDAARRRRLRARS